jgi:hypothetical protein
VETKKLTLWSGIESNRTKGVMSSRLCKELEGAIFPFQIKSLENGVNDSVHALHVHKANHGAGAALDFREAALDDVRSKADKSRWLKPTHKIAAQGSSEIRRIVV